MNKSTIISIASSTTTRRQRGTHEPEIDLVHPANTFRLVDALIKANKRFDFMILPGQRHGYGPDQPYFTRMLWNYFAEYLLGDYRANVNMFEDVLDTKATSPAQAPPTEGRRRQ